jgi:hypothetical protein
VLVRIDRATIVRWEHTRRVPSIELSSPRADVLGLDRRDVSYLGHAHRAGGTSRSKMRLAVEPSATALTGPSWARTSVLPASWQASGRQNWPGGSVSVVHVAPLRAPAVATAGLEGLP